VIYRNTPKESDIKEYILRLWLECVVKVDEASEIKNIHLCIVDAQTSRLITKGSRLMKNYSSNSISEAD